MPSKDAIDRIEALSAITVLRRERLLRVPHTAALILVGGMGAGKSTLARAIGVSEETRDAYEIAPRVTTRSPREREQESIQSLTWEQFVIYRSTERLALSWVRPLSDGTAVGYGCEPIESNRIALQLVPRI